MIIKKNRADGIVEWCPRPKDGIELIPDVSFNKINDEVDITLSNLILKINEKLNTLNKETITDKYFNNYNTRKTLNEIYDCVNSAKNYINITIYNFDKNIHIDVIKNFFVIDCLNIKNTANNDVIKNFFVIDCLNIKNTANKVEPAAPIKLNDITLGFVNFNYYNNNNRILLDYALKSLEKYNDISKFNFIVVNDNKTVTDDFISTKPNFKTYNIKDYNKINFNLTTKFIDLSHCFKIDFLISKCETKYLFLCDCDIIFKGNISEYIDLIKTYDIVGEMGYDKVYPFFMGLNVDTIKSKNYIFGDFGDALEKGDCFITCNNLKNDINQFKFKNINLDSIIYHYGGASYITRLDKNNPDKYLGQSKYIKDSMKNLTVDEFIKLL